MTPAAIPSLDEIARDPARLAALPRETIVALLARVNGLQSALAWMLVADSRSADPVISPSDPRDSITLEAASRILGRSKNWILRNRTKKHLPFIRQVSDKTFMVSESSLRKWIESRKGRKLDDDITDSYIQSHGEEDQEASRAEGSHPTRARQEVADHPGLSVGARIGRAEKSVDPAAS
jgi:hypothetical protein